jgi:1-pyrroline-5-carboxylate dehydrogenase
MSNGFFKAPTPVNEPVLNYLPGSNERDELKTAISKARSTEVDIGMYIGGDKLFTDNKVRVSPPHDTGHTLGHYSKGSSMEVGHAIDAAMGAKEQWAKLDWEHRASIFLKAADLLAGPYRAKINAATMLGQSKNVYQAEIDSACELIDFLRFNVHFMTEIYQQQPYSPRGVWNRLEQRPLEGFVFAITPFNFTAIAGNLPTAPAIMGNTVVWKPSAAQIYSAQVIMEVLVEAGLPDGVINMVFAQGKETSELALSHPDFGGVHFTGSTAVFQDIWRTIGKNIGRYKSYPRIVGETGGKDFIIAHQSADVESLATALTRGAFEYQGQKCSAASRAYIPLNKWDEVAQLMVDDIKSIKMGGVEDFRNFFNAVIDEKAFDKIAGYIDKAKKNKLVSVVAGSGHDKSKGYFIEPTVLLTRDPLDITMCEEIFGPVLSVYLYHSDRFEEALELADSSSPYSLTGSIFANDRHAIQLATEKLVNAAGNFYINDKPTGAVVGQQPFGGSRASGTNDKAGSVINLLRWVSPRAIKENFMPPTDFRYPFMDDE